MLLSEVIKLLEDFDELYKELKDYREILTNPDSRLLEAKRKDELFAGFPFLQEYLPKKSNEEIKEELREKLVKKSVKLSPYITKLVGTDEITIHEYGQPRSVKIWNMGLRAEFDYRTSEALNACIDYTLQAIAKLEAEGDIAEITNGELNGRVRIESESPVDKGEESTYQKIWQWIDTHRVLSILGAVAAIATIIGVIIGLT